MRRVTSLVIFGETAAKAATAITAILLIRFLPVSQYATLTVIQSLVGVVVSATSSGVNRLYILDFSTGGWKHERGPLFGAQVILALIAITFLCWVFGMTIHGIVSGSVLASSLLAISFLRTEYQRRDEFRLYVGVEFVRNIVYLGLIVGLVIIPFLFDPTAVQVILLQASSAALVSIPLLWRLEMLDEILDLRRGLAAARNLLTGHNTLLFGYFALLALFAQLDVLMLSNLSDDTNVGSYGSAYRYYSILLLSAGAAKAVLLPRIASANNRREIESVYSQHRGLLVVFVPVVFLISCAAWWVIPWLDAGRYPNAVGTFWLLAVSSVVSFALSPYSTYVMKRHHYKPLVGVLVAACILNIALNMWLIPLHGAVGAAATTLICYGWINIHIYNQARRLIRKESDDDAHAQGAATAGRPL